MLLIIVYKINWKQFFGPAAFMISTELADILSLSAATWWRHQMETFSALLVICAGNSPVPDEFPTQRPVTRSFDVFFDLLLTKRLSKQSWGWWLETLSRPLWRHRNEGPLQAQRWYSIIISCNMMTSSNGNIFRVTGHLCGEFTGPRWIPHTKASDAELWCFLWSASD